MPKRKPDRDDSRGGLGEGGPQHGPIGGGGDRQSGGDDAGGEGGQRQEGGSSRDSENQR
jgi:hypothetical protein